MQAIIQAVTQIALAFINQRHAETGEVPTAAEVEAHLATHHAALVALIDAELARKVAISSNGYINPSNT